MPPTLPDVIVKPNIPVQAIELKIAAGLVITGFGAASLVGRGTLIFGRGPVLNRRHFEDGNLKPTLDATP